jgi:hypothetical protein
MLHTVVPQEEFSNVTRGNELYSVTPQQYNQNQHYNQQMRMNFWQAGAMGLNPLRKRHNVYAPTGYRVLHTRKGQPYLARDTLDQQTVASITEEHARSKLGTFCTWNAIEEEFGLGVRIYFNTCIIVSCFIAPANQ